MIDMKKIETIFIGFVFILTASLCWAITDDYPNKPVQIVCAFAPGGTSDLSARIVGNKLTEFLGQPFVVVNKPGGGCSVGINYVVGSKPDGYTLLTASAAMVLLPMITPQLPYKMGDLVPFGRLVTYNNMIVANKDLPVKDLSDFVAYAKKHPGTISYSSAGIGNTSHFIGELINMEAKIDAQHIPYNGDNPAITAVLGNHAQVTYVSLPTCLPHVKSGAVKGLAVLSSKRDPELPEIPTAKEQGFDYLIASSYFIFYAPAKISAAILKKLEASLYQVIQDKDVRKKIEDLGLTINYLNSEDSKKFLDNEYKKWSGVAKKANIVIK